jgi:hypothetical protein
MNGLDTTIVLDKGTTVAFPMRNPIVIKVKDGERLLSITEFADKARRDSVGVGLVVRRELIPGAAGAVWAISLSCARSLGDFPQLCFNGALCIQDDPFDGHVLKERRLPRPCPNDVRVPTSRLTPP